MSQISSVAKALGRGPKKIQDDEYSLLPNHEPFVGVLPQQGKCCEIAGPRGRLQDLSTLQNIKDFVRHHRRVVYALPPILAGTLWGTMMLYFLIYYLTLPRDPDGKLPRIGPEYSTWPYISCIGAVRLPYFESFSIAVAALVFVAFYLDLYIGREVQPGAWWRRAKCSLGCLSSIFLIALSFVVIKADNHNHLIFTSIQIWSMGAAKTSDYFLSYRMRRHSRKNRWLLFAKLWKRCIGICAARKKTSSIFYFFLNTTLMH